MVYVSPLTIPLFGFFATGSTINLGPFSCSIFAGAGGSWRLFFCRHTCIRLSRYCKEINLVIVRWSHELSQVCYLRREALRGVPIRCSYTLASFCSRRLFYSGDQGVIVDATLSAQDVAAVSALQSSPHHHGDAVWSTSIASLVRLPTGGNTIPPFSDARHGTRKGLCCASLPGPF